MTTHAVNPLPVAQIAAAVNADPMMVALVTATPAQIDAYVATHVTTLAQAQTAIAFLAKCIVYLWNHRA